MQSGSNPRSSLDLARGRKMAAVAASGPQRIFCGKRPHPAPSRASRLCRKKSPLSAAHSVLQAVFGYEQFRGPQEAIVSHVVAGGDALVLMPTGGGKSLCYQVPAIVRQQQGHGVAVVVSPPIALLHHQGGAPHEGGVSAPHPNSPPSHYETQEVERRPPNRDNPILVAPPQRPNTP